MLSKRVREMLDEDVSYPLAESSSVEEPVKLCSNENPFGPSPKAVEMIKKEAENIGKYPKSVPGELKRAIGEYLRLEPRKVCVGNGSDEIMDLACKAFLDPGEKVLIPIPTFSQYELASRVNATVPKFVELENFRWNADNLVKGMNDAKMAFIGRPNNPTGNSIEEEGLELLLRTGKTIVVDEAYVEFSDSSIIDWVDDYDNLLVLRTFSKLFGLAGLRVGYGVGNMKMIRALERVRAPFSVNTLAQKAAIAALEDEKFVERSKKTILEGREYLRKKLKDLGFKVLPSDANFLMASPKPRDKDADDVCNYLLEEGIMIRNLSNFRGVGKDWIRITVGIPEQNKRLIKSLEKYMGDEE